MSEQGFIVAGFARACELSLRKDRQPDAVAIATFAVAPASCANILKPVACPTA